MRRILLLVTDLLIGGTPTVVRELALRLRDGRTHVGVCSLAEIGPVGQELLAAGVPVHALRASGVRHAPRALAQLVKLIRRERYGTLLSFLLHANALAAAAKMLCPGLRLVSSIQTTQPRPRWHWSLQRLIASAPNVFIVPSPSVAAIARRWCGIDRRKIHIIPNAVDRPNPPDDRPTHAPIRVGFIGRLDPVKRIEDAVEAIRLLGEGYRLDIYGEGAHRPAIQAAIAACGVAARVTMHGAIPSSTPALATMDVLVLPSSAEGFGLVLIEAMAAGVPVVAANVHGIRDVVNHQQTGLLVPPAHPAALATAIERIVRDEALRNRLIAAGVEHVRRRFSWDVVLPRYRKVLS